jgi:hypothetical protein
MPLSLPVYFLGRTFVLHTRINGRQFKRSLKTADPRTAKLRAIELLRAAQMAIKGDNPKLSDFNFDPKAFSKYKFNPSTGAIETDGTQQDHDNMMAAIERIGMIPGGWPKSQPVASVVVAAREDEPIATAADWSWCVGCIPNIGAISLLMTSR